MNYGFVIDNRKCIGCHACSTACKSENEVPLGVNRTWVKYVETGLYPDATRHFQVTRCNHCANPPCVRICPVTAMYQRDDGIVEFDPNACIGCKACMQACPYDAVYIDPESHTAAKCHFCAHRVDIGLEPACVVVCPEHAIIAGDMNNPSSEIGHYLATQKVTVRKPEQGTAPKLFYVDGNDVSLYPTATQRTPESYLWSDVIPLHAKPAGGHLPLETLGIPNGPPAPMHQEQGGTKRARSGAPLRGVQTQGHNRNGPIQLAGGRMADHMVQVAYNAQHLIPWHWPVPAYLVTKGIGSGIFMVLSLGLGLRLFAVDSMTNILLGFLSLLFVGITTALLVYDLDRPERFLFILTRPQWQSWLTRGAFLLIGFTFVAGLWWLVEVAVGAGWIGGGGTLMLRTILLWLGLPLAGGAAIYTAFLFGQAEGRDLWQSTLLPVHLVVQALMVGCAMILVADLVASFSDEFVITIRIAFGALLLIDLFITLAGEFGMPHAGEAAARAAHEISHGPYRIHFWGGSIVAGHLVALALLLIGWTPAVALAGLLSIVGLYLFEYAFVMAPQEIPNS